VCRFAPARVRVDGEELPRGFEQAIAEGALAFPLAGRVAIPAGHDEVRLWLLSAGVVRAHLTVPGVPAFEAFVDGDRLAGSGASAAALRDAVQPHVATIVDQAVGLLLEAAGTTLQRPAEHQRRLRAGLLLAARRRLRLRDVLAAPAFPALDGTSRAPRALSLLDVGREAARAPRFTLWALDPRTDPRDVVLPAETVLLLDPEERARLAEQLGVRFATPPAREVRGTWRRRLRARLDALGRTVRSLGSRLALAAGRLVPPEHTSAAERALIQALAVRIERGGEALEVAFTDGAGTARRRGRRPSRLLLPRRNPTVRAAVLALGRDPRWGYAAAVALCDEAGLESPALFVP
jgi:hypothetical protein